MMFMLKEKEILISLQDKQDIKKNNNDYKRRNL